MKKIVIILLFIFSISFAVVYQSTEGYKTIEEAVIGRGTNALKIIHVEETDKGSIVFSKIDEGDTLYTAIVIKNIKGYKTVYSGVQGDITKVAETFGISLGYWPGIKKTSLPMYCGIIGNDEIKEIIVVEQEGAKEGVAKIINANGYRIWLIHMEGFKGSKFNIIGLSEEGEEIINIKENISPYYVEQKPFKGYK